MSERSTRKKSERDWAQAETRAAVKSVLDRGVMPAPVAEGRPIWSKPYEVVIGQLREQGAQEEFLWIIGGNMPVDFIHSDVAESPRAAARHFSLKWQLDASRLEDAAERDGLIEQAEYLYELAENDRFWK